MSISNELRNQVGKFALAAGAAFLIFALFLGQFHSSWSWVSGAVGFWLLGLGIALSVFEGIPKLMRVASRHTEPKWDGETLFTDSGRHQVRYKLDSRRRPWFVANDICTAIGADAPGKDAVKWGGARLLVHDERLCFSRESIEAYLVPLAVQNREAGRLLTILRNDVFRKLDRERQEQSCPAGGP